ncbi:hypothetical protein NUW58_g184 [Xylaria curta]|uniref:Uncharacterized protein n=1 Tax=Xylaria curta TaxID=42375 RepID=A0ACC1PT47_9PEZI|nr:hypothetical protein NUW58_g184 [Xylaria curta]
MSFYSELKHRQIRLATIRPGEWAELLQCYLDPSTLDQVPKVSYKALSYVWGPPHATEIVEINGELQNATVNLACAIRHLRNTETPIKIWIDALCINQSNIFEKGEQVALMRDICAGAEEVIVFLGDGVNRRIPQGYLTQPLPPPVIFWNDPRDNSHLQQFRALWHRAGRGRVGMPSMSFVSFAVCLKKATITMQRRLLKQLRPGGAEKYLNYYAAWSLNHGGNAFR